MVRLIVGVLGVLGVFIDERDQGIWWFASSSVCDQPRFVRGGVEDWSRGFVSVVDAILRIDLIGRVGRVVAEVG